MSVALRNATGPSTLGLYVGPPRGVGSVVRWRSLTWSSGPWGLDDSPDPGRRHDQARLRCWIFIRDPDLATKAGGVLDLYAGRY